MAENEAKLMKGSKHRSKFKGPPNRINSKRKTKTQTHHNKIAKKQRKKMYPLRKKKKKRYTAYRGTKKNKKLQQTSYQKIYKPQDSLAVFLNK